MSGSAASVVLASFGIASDVINVVEGHFGVLRPHYRQNFDHYWTRFASFHFNGF